MTQQQPNPQSTQTGSSAQNRLANSYYGILGVTPEASAREIRQAYRELSKRYHPDTTQLSLEEAKTKFQKLNEAYATVSNPEKRALYDIQIGYFRQNLIQPLPSLKESTTQNKIPVGYLDPIDRPLSAGEISVLFILCIIFVACLLLVIALAYFRGDPL